MQHTKAMHCPMFQTAMKIDKTKAICADYKKLVKGLLGV